MKAYIGDSVYVDFDGDSLVLTTENGYRATNTIVMEPAVYEALTLYVERLKSPIQGMKLGKPTFDDMCEHGKLKCGVNID